MMIFLVLKERLKSFYGKYATPVNGVIKFIYSFVAMALLNGNIGYQTELTGPVAMAVVALFSAFLPYGAIGCMLGAVMLAHIYAVSMETALIHPDHSDPAVLRIPAGGQLLAGADACGIFTENPIRSASSGRIVRKPSYCDTGRKRSGDRIHHFLCQAECRPADK